MRISTFSIAAADLKNQEWGVGVASKFLAVGAVVPWARAKVGAVATQAWANVTFGPRGLDLLDQGRMAQEVVDELVASDEGREHRQIGVVDERGGAATYTGSSCLEWAGGITGDAYSVQGNILAGPEVIERIAEEFVSTQGALADRLIAALLAGDRAGGDRRGRQSAAVLVVREGGGYGGGTDVLVDLRADDHPDPVVELGRLRMLHRLYLETPSPDEAVAIDAVVGAELQELLVALGAYDGQRTGEFDQKTAEAMLTWMGIENLEMRWLGGDKLDRTVLEYMRSKAGE